jgi:hypothetical protein
MDSTSAWEKASLLVFDARGYKIATQSAAEDEYMNFSLGDMVRMVELLVGGDAVKIEVTLSQWRSVIAIPNLSLHFWLFQFLLNTYNRLAG